MSSEITAIKVDLPYRLGNVNCYLIKTESGYILIDTGSTNNRQELIDHLKNAGCMPGNLNLIILTHGDFDHTGNAADLRRMYQASIAMHESDVRMLTDGDMFANRKQPNIIIRILTSIMFGFGRDRRCVPDLLIQDKDDLSQYGLSARVVSLPGHSMGSIGIITAEGDLFCGDLFENTKKPAFNTIMDDQAGARSSIEKLKQMNIQTVYPGHGCPFQFSQIVEMTG